ncbi:MAG: TrbC/VirB2 family protein [Sphingomonas sp.]
MHSLLDPPDASPIVAAVSWVQGTLLGTVATASAIIAVASVGYGMLSGRASWRHGSRVVLGCLILFGAPSVVRGVQSRIGTYLPSDLPIPAYPVAREAPPQLVIPEVPQQPSDQSYDPYAGAAAPSQ